MNWSIGRSISPIEIRNIALALGLTDRDMFILVVNSGSPNGKHAGVQ